MIRALGLTAIALGLAALVLVIVWLADGRQAGGSAEALLAAYRAKETPAPLDDAAIGLVETPPPADADFEQTDADEDSSEAALANEHLADDGTDPSEYEGGDYIRPDAPESDADLQATIQKIVAATGENGLIGVLEIPAIDVELPIIGKWSYKLLKLSVCRYKGPAPNKSGNLVVIGHNYRDGSHFGRLSKLSVGDELYLTDAATNTRMRYTIYQIKTIEADAFSALKSYRGDCGLTLLTCKDSGTRRLLVRCEQAAATSVG